MTSEAVLCLYWPSAKLFNQGAYLRCIITGVRATEAAIGTDWRRKPNVYLTALVEAPSAARGPFTVVSTQSMEHSAFRVYSEQDEEEHQGSENDVDSQNGISKQRWVGKVGKNNRWWW